MALGSPLSLLKVGISFWGYDVTSYLVPCSFQGVFGARRSGARGVSGVRGMSNARGVWCQGVKTLPPPPPRKPQKWALHILLECILAVRIFWRQGKLKWEAGCMVWQETILTGCIQIKLLTTFSSGSSTQVRGQETWNLCGHLWWQSFLPLTNKVWGKVIFSEACVKNSVHGGGGGWYPSMHFRFYPSMPCRYLGGIPACLAGLQAHTQGGSWGVWPRGVSRPTPGGLQAHTWGGLQAQTQGVSQHALRQTFPADGYCWGWYTSYWNAFLLWLIFTRPGGHGPLDQLLTLPFFFL